MNSTTHVAAPYFGIARRMIQRCGICGEKLIDLDFDRVAVPEGPDGKPGELPGGFPTAALVRCVGNAQVVVGSFEQSDPLPPDFCLELVERG